eukprot:5910114-Lingulodinium_polyedra.AAC.1
MGVERRYLRRRRAAAASRRERLQESAGSINLLYAGMARGLRGSIPYGLAPAEVPSGCAGRRGLSDSQ